MYVLILSRLIPLSPYVLRSRDHVTSLLAFLFIVSQLRWTGHIIRMPEENPVKKLTLLRPEGSRRAGRPKLRWLDGVEDDLRTLCIRCWRRRALDRDGWKEVFTAARAKNGL